MLLAQRHTLRRVSSKIMVTVFSTELFPLVYTVHFNVCDCVSVCAHGHACDDLERGSYEI